MYLVNIDNKFKMTQKLFLLKIILLIFSGTIFSQNNKTKLKPMKVAIWDTYVKRKDGRIMHFDIIVPETIKEPDKVYQFGREYLISKGEKDANISSKECRFCHIEKIKPEWEKDIQSKGYSIYEMENCD